MNTRRWLRSGVTSARGYLLLAALTLLAGCASAPDRRSINRWPLFKRTLRPLLEPPQRPDGLPIWLLLHRPIWYDLLDAGAPPNALQVVLAGRLPANVEFVFAGHQHAFQTINFVRAADPASYPTGRPAHQSILMNSLASARVPRL